MGIERARSIINDDEFFTLPDEVKREVLMKAGAPAGFIREFLAPQGEEQAQGIVEAQAPAGTVVRTGERPQDFVELNVPEQPDPQEDPRNQGFLAGMARPVSRMAANTFDADPNSALQQLAQTEAEDWTGTAGEMASSMVLTAPLFFGASSVSMPALSALSGLTAAGEVGLETKDPISAAVAGTVGAALPKGMQLAGRHVLRPALREAGKAGGRVGRLSQRAGEKVYGLSFDKPPRGSVLTDATGRPIPMERSDVAREIVESAERSRRMPPITARSIRQRALDELVTLRDGLRAELAEVSRRADLDEASRAGVAKAMKNLEEMDADTLVNPDGIRNAIRPAEDALNGQTVEATNNVAQALARAGASDWRLNLGTHGGLPGLAGAGAGIAAGSGPVGVMAGLGVAAAEQPILQRTAGAVAIRGGQLLEEAAESRVPGLVKRTLPSFARTAADDVADAAEEAAETRMRAISGHMGEERGAGAARGADAGPLPPAAPTTPPKPADPKKIIEVIREHGEQRGLAPGEKVHVLVDATGEPTRVLSPEEAADAAARGMRTTWSRYVPRGTKAPNRWGMTAEDLEPRIPEGGKRPVLQVYKDAPDNLGEIAHEPVRSGGFRSWGYKDGVLEVTDAGGKTYRYYGVTEAEMKPLRNLASQGESGTGLATAIRKTVRGKDAIRRLDVTAGEGEADAVSDFVREAARRAEGTDNAIRPGQALNVLLDETGEPVGLVSEQAARKAKDAGLQVVETRYSPRGPVPKAQGATEPAPLKGSESAKIESASVQPNELGFFSQLERVVTDAKQSKMPAAEWRKFLADPKRGVKAAELRWSGLDDFLARKRGQKVTKGQILDHLNENNVRIEEVTKGARAAESKVDPADWLGEPVDAQVGPHGWLVFGDEGRPYGSYAAASAEEALALAREKGPTDFGLSRVPDSYEPVAAEALRLEQAAQRLQRRNPEEASRLFERAERIQAVAEDISLGKGGQPKFGEYALPGGKNYREVLLRRAPSGREGAILSARQKVINKFKPELDEINGRLARDAGSMNSSDIESLRFRRDDLEAAMEAELKKVGEAPPAAGFRGGHFDEPNVVAHLRLTDRKGPNGEKILFVEEIQSDWAAAGRTQGFARPNEKLVAKEVRDASGKKYFEVSTEEGRFVTNVFDAGVDTPEAAIAEAQRRITTAPQRTGQGSVPPAPFVEKTGDWTDLAMKRVLRMAADEGYDRVAWTTGRQQAARYDLSKRVSRVIWDEDSKTLKAFDLQGEEIISRQGVEAKDLPDYIGKEAAEKLANQKPIGKRWDVVEGREGFRIVDDAGQTVENAQGEPLLFQSRSATKEYLKARAAERELVGQELEVGGEGLKKLYDQIIPKSAKKAGKRFGAQVEEIPLTTTAGQRYSIRESSLPGTKFSVYDEERNVAVKYFNEKSNAEAFAAELNNKTTNAGPVQSIRITPEMRESISREGFPQFKVEGKAPSPKAAAPLSVESVEANLPKFFKGKVAQEGDDFVVKTGRGEIRIRQNGNIEISSAALEKYPKGTAEALKAGTARVEGRTVTIGKDSLIEVVEKGTIPHESAHAFLDNFATPAERGLIEQSLGKEAQSLGKSVDELFAEGYEAYFKSSEAARLKRANTPLGRVYERIREFFLGVYDSIRPSLEETYRKVGKGKVFARAEGGSAATSVAAPIPKGQKAILKARGVHATDDGAVAVDHGSIRTVEDSKQAIRQLNRQTGWFTEPQLKKYFKDLDDVTSKVLERRAALDYTPAKHVSALKANADPQYGKSLDFTTLCKKRYRMQATIDEAQRRLGRPLNSEEVMDVRKALQEAGVETSCGACYVDSRRAHMSTVIEKAKDELPKETHDLLLSTEGLAELAEKYPAENATFRKLFAGTNIKIPEARTEYRGEILKLSNKQVEAMNEASGLRWQSWSDFEPPHLLDAMQAIGDMSQKQLKGHAYTKVPEFVRALAPTKLAINMSLIPKGTGVAKSGKRLVFDPTQSFPFREGLRLRKKYPNVGFEVIGISDDHIRAALRDPNIDFVIPYHSSGLSKRFQKKLGMSDWTDYSGENQFRWASGPNKGKVADKEIFWAEFEGDMDEFRKLLKKRSLTPPFERFADEGGYYKLLTDRRAYDAEGNYIMQEMVEPNFDMRAIQKILDDYSSEGADFVEEVVEQVVRAGR